MASKERKIFKKKCNVIFSENGVIKGVSARKRDKKTKRTAVRSSAMRWLGTERALLYVCDPPGRRVEKESWEKQHRSAYLAGNRVEKRDFCQTAAAAEARKQQSLVDLISFTFLACITSFHEAEPIFIFIFNADAVSTQFFLCVHSELVSTCQGSALKSICISQYWRRWS